MKTINAAVITLVSRSINEGFARAVVGAFASQLDPSLDELNDIKTAVSEAVTNCIVHAYPDRQGIITIGLKVFDNHSLEIVVKDKGVGIPDIEQAMQPAFTTGGEERAGLGFTLMENFCNRVTVKSKVGKGTTVKLSKRVAVRSAKRI